ncbi:MAG: hypothetical protein L0J35_05585 [Tetragenococcus halophilus]|nr:hypothetical protein [Tetragenococcus halophilus]
MHKELKKQIVSWLLENENRWQRVNSCSNEFSDYIYNQQGEFLIGGEDVYEFILEADKLIYK